jgi:hypothetical protein
MNRKKIANMYKTKLFLKVLYDPVIGSGGNLTDDQYIRVYQQNNLVTKIHFYDNIDDLVTFAVGNKVKNHHTCFTLSTTNGKGGAEEDLITRTVLGWDFDKDPPNQDLNHKDIINRFTSLNLWYHAIIDSGNGYHVYMAIEPTKDIHKVVEVTKAIGKKVGADHGAMKTTQILRLPYSFNIKDPKKHKRVNIIHSYPPLSVMRYNLDGLYNRFCNMEKYTDKKTISYTTANTNLPICIKTILTEGSKETQRNHDLQNIVVVLREKNKSLAEIKQICREWNLKSDFNDRLEYRVKHAYYNKKYAELDCPSCRHRSECFNRIESDFEFPDDLGILSLSATHMRYLKPPSKKGVKKMEPNDFLVYSILKNNEDGLYRDEIIDDMTYKKQCRLSKNLLTRSLQNLDTNGFIEVSIIGRKKFYKVKSIRSNIELTYSLSYAAVYECIKGNISTEELRLYSYMRYLHNRGQRKNPKALKGNLFYLSQEDLAKELKCTQGRISQMINNLLEEKLLGIWYRQPSKNHGYDYYIYRLNY